MAELEGIDADDEQLMGTLDLKDFLPTNEELQADALNGLGSQSITEIDIPKISKDTIHKLEHYGHQDVDYHNPQSARSVTKGFPDDNESEDIFNVDFGEEDDKIKKPQLSVTAPVKLQTPISSTKLTEPDREITSIQHNHTMPIQHQPHIPAKISEEEEEEELFVIPRDASSKSAPSVAANTSGKSSPVNKIQPSTTVTSLPQRQLLESKSPTGSIPTKALIEEEHTPPGSIHKEKSREDTLPGKLQKKVSEARLLEHSNNENHNDDVTEEDLNPPTKEEEDEMMTDIEDLLLNRAHQNHEEDHDEFVLHGRNQNQQEGNDEELDENVDEFEIDVDHHATHRYKKTLQYQSESEHDDFPSEDANYDAENDCPKPQRSENGPSEKKGAKERKSKLLVSQERKEINESNDNNNDVDRNTKTTGTRKRHYQHPLNQSKVTFGNRTLTLAEAKLYGLVDAEGNQIPLSALGSTKSGSKDTKVPMKRISDMAQPRPPATAPPVEEEGYTFQPQRSASALKAMKNPKLGYDFVDRLKTGGDFLQRLNKDNHKKVGGGNKTKAELAAMEEDYNARHDKLTCPNCGKEQSFDEFLERSRMCRLCNVKYTKANVSSGLSFMKQNALREAERERKLQKIEQEMYGDVGVTKIASGRPSSTLPTIPVRTTNHARKTANNLSNTSHQLLAKPPSPGDQAEPNQQATIKKSSNSTQNTTTTEMRPGPKIASLNPRPPSANKIASSQRAQSNSHAPLEAVQAPLTSNQNATEAVETMRRLHNAKAQDLNNLVQNLVNSSMGSNPSHYDKQGKAQGHQNSNKANPRETSVGRKMDRLMQFD